MNYPNLKLVVGITGLKAGGKDELSRLLKDRGFNVRRVSDAVREECSRRGFIDPTIEQLQNVGDQERDKSKDNGFWAGRLLEMLARDDNPLAAINGIRNPGEIENLRRNLGGRFVLVGITAPTMVRYERMTKRQQSGDLLELKSFLMMDDRDRGVGQPFNGQQVDRCLSLVPAENLFCNRGTMEEYKNWIENLLLRIQIKVAV